MIFNFWQASTFLLLVKLVTQFQFLSFPAFFETEFSETLFQQISSLKIHLVILTKEDWQNQQAAGNSGSNKAPMAMYS